MCNRDGCRGRIETIPVQNCSCHINPPCSACTAPRNVCWECGWKESEDIQPSPKYVPLILSSDGPSLFQIASFPKPLDPTKIDYRIKGHSNSSQICEGVYPPGTTMDAVRKVVDGTFGGRFESFGGGKFKFIAYTD